MPKKYSLELLQELALQRGGECLSTNYENSYTKMKWRCNKNHIWETTARKIKLGHWCPRCKKITIDDMKALAKAKNGVCLSQIYINATTHLDWRCEKGHIWSATPSSIRAGRWCHDCGGTKRLNINDIHELAKQNNGFLLSTEYKNNRTKLMWKCSEGHIFWAKVNHIKDSKIWCSACSGKKRLCIEKMREEAIKRGGECLSQVYINTRTPLEWKCSKSHTWFDKYDHIRHGRWCPHCNNRFFSERKCKYIFEKLMKAKFTKNRTALGNGHELDGYNSELKLAFEYQGEQHYKYIEYFHGDIPNFINRRNSDLLKRKICYEKNITLIIIPHSEASTDETLFAYITQQLKLNNFDVNTQFFEIKMNNFYINLDQLNEAKEIAVSRKGKCLSESFIDSKQKLKWKCECNNIWFQNLTTIKMGSWCPACNGTPKATIGDMTALAKKHNGLFLSTKYLGTSVPHKWECENRHIFMKKPVNVKQGKWCPICTKTKRIKYKHTIDDLHQSAKERNGYCLSDEYINKEHKYIWKCSNNHIWKASYGSIRSGSWCKECWISNSKKRFTH